MYKCYANVFLFTGCIMRPYILYMYIGLAEQWGLGLCDIYLARERSSVTLSSSCINLILSESSLAK